MRAGWGSRGAWLCGTHQLGMVARARCGRLIKPDEARDLGHDDENRSVHTGPEHVRCKRATLPRMLAKAAMRIVSEACRTRTLGTRRIAGVAIGTAGSTLGARLPSDRRAV